MIPLRFTVEDAQKASDAWSFNCGPGALCGLLGMTPDELRPNLGEFEQKGYTNPTLMKDALGRLGRTFTQIYRGDVPQEKPTLAVNGLLRIQWGGPWTKPGVPMRVRYRHTHWVASSLTSGTFLPRIFDVNATCSGWIRYREWSEQLVPWLLKQCEPKSDGTWWVTHAWEVNAAPK